MANFDSNKGQVAFSSTGTKNQTPSLQCLDEKFSGKPTNTNSYDRTQILDNEPRIYTYPPSPIYRLSADVLHSIFELCCNGVLKTSFPIKSSTPQFVISHICSAWRQIVLNGPAFWNKISIISRSASYNKMIEPARIWLSRAKDLSCFIEFNILPSFSISTGDMVFQHDFNKNIVQELIYYSNCKSLAATFADYHLHELLQLSDEKLSYIEILRIRYVHNDSSRETVSQLDFHKLSSLTHFSLYRADQSVIPIPGKDCRYFDMFSSIRWHQLCYIYLHVELPALRCLDILETSSPVLEACCLIVSEDFSFKFSPPSRIRPVHCPQLRELKIYIFPNEMLDNGESFLLCLRLPKLKSLELNCPITCPTTINPQTLFRMQKVCNMRPEELIISDDSVCDADAGTLLATMPSLRRLELPERSMFTVEAIRELGLGSIGPLLEELTINNSEISNELDELIQMVKARSSAYCETIPVPFRSVTLWCSDQDKKLQEQYGAIIDEINQLGVQFTVKFVDYMPRTPSLRAILCGTY